MTDAQRLDLARQFIARIKPSMETIDPEEKQKRAQSDISKIPEGEELFFRIRLTKDIALDYQLLATVQNGKLVLSFQDFLNAVEFPIAFDGEKGQAAGWYIRENKNFSLDMAKRQVVTDKGSFIMSENVVARDDDIYVPSEEISQWFGFTLEPNITFLELALKSDTKLPVQEQAERRDRKFDNSMDMLPPALPPLKDEQAALAFPLVDVTSFSSYSRPGDGTDPQTMQTASVRTSGDVANGTLTTQSQFSKEERLTSLRATYSKQSLAPELLGPLKARRYELGDITPVDIPLSDRYASGMGARVTNRDPLRGVTGASTIISGPSLPGWDVELYRDNQLVDIQTVGDNGTYTFPNVDLFSTDNTFRVVQYGLQGEIREEEIAIPVDPKRFSDFDSAYDVSLVRQDTDTYTKFDSVDDEDDGAPSLAAFYELPLTQKTALTTGLVTRQDAGDQKATANAGISTSFANTLWNFNTAVENTGEMAGEIITRKDFRKHQFRNEARFATDKFGSEDQTLNLSQAGAFVFTPTAFEREVFGNELSANGPLDISLGLRPRYNINLNYSKLSDNENLLNSGVGFSTVFTPVSFNQQFIYSHSDSVEEDTINSLTNLNGSFGRNRVRLSSDYEIKPDAELKRVAASVNRRLSPTMDFQTGVTRLMDSKLTEVNAQLNWDTGYGNIAPGITYNTDRDLTALVTTRVGLTRDPRSGKPKLFDQSISTNGGVSAFVYLDKDGDMIFNNEDEPIQDAIVKAPQNGGREITDKDGNAFFSRMAALRMTDVYVDPDSLADPYWIPAYQGAAIFPREGHVVPLEFPVHISGEMDGTLYVKDSEQDTSFPLKGVSLGLYDKAGKKIQGTRTEQDGYYIFSKIPPGTHYLVVDDTRLQGDQARPLPQQVNIGYGGTTIYANNIYVTQGKTDVPLSVLADGLPYDQEKADLYKGRDFALNLGQYKSRLAMGLAWFKIRATAAKALSGTDLVEKPAETTPTSANGGYVLRVSVQENNLQEAYKKCSEIARKGNFCSLEILPGGLGEKVAVR